MIDKLTLLSSIVLLAAQEAVPNGVIDPLASLGAVSVLGLVVIGLLFRVLPKMADAWIENSNLWRTTIVGLEQQRHADELELHRHLNQLASAIQSLETHCSKQE